MTPKASTSSLRAELSPPQAPLYRGDQRPLIRLCERGCQDLRCPLRRAAIGRAVGWWTSSLCLTTMGVLTRTMWRSERSWRIARRRPQWNARRSVVKSAWHLVEEAPAENSRVRSGVTVCDTVAGERDWLLRGGRLLLVG